MYVADRGGYAGEVGSAGGGHEMPGTEVALAAGPACAVCQT